MKKHNLHFVVFLLFLQFSFTAFSAQPFRFALFTDLHISSLKPQNAEDLKNAVEDVNSQKEIDFVLIAGDNADNGDLASFREAKILLDKLHIPYYISTGNHDTNYGETGAAHFNSVFGSDTFSFIHHSFQFIGFPTSPLNRQSKAHLTTHELKFIKSKLNKNKNRYPVFLITHYPMLKGDVDNWHDLHKILKKSQIIAVLSGHYHRNVLLNYAEIPGIVNRSTLRGKENLGGYSIYSIADSLKVSEKTIGKPERNWLTLPLNNKK